MILYETNILRIESVYEYVVLRNKASNEILLENEFYGDPQCGLIDHNNEWAVIAGDHIVVWNSGRTSIIKNNKLSFIHSLRMKSRYAIELLVDPWSDLSAIWNLDIDSCKLNRIDSFNAYKDTEWTDEVNW